MAEASQISETKRRPSFKDLRRRPPPASETIGRIFFFAGVEVDEEERYFLDRCSLCKKRIARDEDVFMYRGNVPFCSDECRDERIEMDEAKECSKRFAIKAVGCSRKETRREPSSTEKDYINCRKHAATAVAA